MGGESDPEKCGKRVESSDVSAEAAAVACDDTD
jgi:hypothetical protein